MSTIERRPNTGSPRERSTESTEGFDGARRRAAAAPEATPAGPPARAATNATEGSAQPLLARAADHVETAPASPIRPPGLTQGPYTLNNFYVGATMSAADGLQFIADTASSLNPKAAQAARGLREFLKANPAVANILSVEVDFSVGGLGEPLVNRNAVIHFKVKVHELANLAPDTRDALMSKIRRVSPGMADLVERETSVVATPFRHDNRDYGVATRSDLRVTGDVVELLAGQDPRWRAGTLHWLPAAELPLPGPIARAWGMKSADVIAFASVRPQDTGLNPFGERGRTQLVFGLEVGGPKVGPAQLLFGVFNNSFVNNAMGPRSQTADVVRGLDENGRQAFGIEVQVPGADGPPQTRFLALPQIENAVLEAVGGDPEQIAGTQAPPISLRDYATAQLESISPEMAVRLTEAARLFEWLGPAAEAFDVGAAAIAPGAALAVGGPVAGLWATFQSLGRMRDRQVDFLVENDVADPAIGAEFVWRGARSGEEMFAELTTLIPDAIRQGLSTGTLDFQETLRAWKDIADNGYHGPESGVVLNSLRVDGPRPHTKGEIIQAFAQNMVYGEVDEPLRGILPGVGGLFGGRPQVIDGFAYYAGALERARTAVDEARQAGAPAPGIDFDNGDMKSAIAASFAFLYDNAPEIHDRLVQQLANSEPEHRTEDFGWGPLMGANEDLRNRRVLGVIPIGILPFVDHVPGSLDRWNIENYTRVSNYRNPAVDERRQEQMEVERDLQSRGPSDAGLVGWTPPGAGGASDRFDWLVG